MRSEEEMYRLILDTARKDSRVRAVYMNGSRANPNAPRDMLQDYDIVYVVNETAGFIRDRHWVSCFGEIAYMQYPNEWPLEESDPARHYAYLMQFTDGVRLDLTLQESHYAREAVLKDKLCRVLLDKDGILPPVMPSTDRDYRVQKPSEALFRACANEFWWCTNNLAKGLWRDELPYVQDMANHVVRPQLAGMLGWKVGVLTDFSVSVGKSSKYMRFWLSDEEYARYLSTYFGSSANGAWQAVWQMAALFEETAVWVADKLGFSYDRAEGQAAQKHLRFVQNLPHPRVILLNGPSGSGKSTLAKLLREQLPAPCAVVSIDDFLQMSPDEPIYEDDVFEISDALCRAVLDRLAAGINVIVDHVITSERIYQCFLSAMRGQKLTTVLVTCPLSVLKAREAARGNRAIGSAEASFTCLYPREGYDLTINTAAMSQDACAESIVKRL